MKSRRLIAGPTGRTRLFASAALTMGAFAIMVAPSTATPRPALKDQTAAAHRKIEVGRPGTLSPAARDAKRYGYLPKNRARYERQKARADRRAAAAQALASPASGGLLAPTKIRSWPGITDNTGAPPDETSAVGTGRYIQLINSKFGIYNKTGNTPIGTGTLNNLVGVPSTDEVFDPQIMWDATTNRFYYAADDVVSASQNFVAYGFSTTANPSSAADWCHGFVAAEATFPDFPKLGDSRDFMIVGTNLFDSSNHYLSSNIFASSKPKATDTCSSWASSHEFSSKSFSSGFTPTPASEIDTNPTGWAVAVAQTNPATKLQLYKITRSSTGAPVINTTPASVTVPSYAIPPSAPEKGTTFKLDTADGRNTQAQAAIDPGHGGKFALWTQHTVKGGAGAEVRWYEINPATHSVIQKGKATSGSLFEFNGAITPNREVKGSTKGGGNAMVMNFNTSSSSTFPSIKMVSKVGSSAQSGQVAVFNGTKPLSGFDCRHAPQPCRWGDYAAATPDPSTANNIWQVSQFGAGTASTPNTVVTSKTLNFVAKP